MSPKSSLDKPVELPVLAIDVRDVSVAFGTREVLRRINFSIAQGTFVCIVGPSGCGKTTLLRALGGLTAPTSGAVFLGEHEVREPEAEVSIVFQDYNRALLPWRTVSGNVALALEARRIPKHQHAERIGALLRRLGLTSYAQHFPAQLSGGLQQRVQIARALAQQPAILLMDEPFGALDALTRQRLQDQLLEIWSATNTTVVFITHDLEEAIYLGDRVVVLDANPGRVAADVAIDLPRPRRQLTTREDPEFLAIRHRLFGLLGET